MMIEIYLPLSEEALKAETRVIIKCGINYRFLWCFNILFIFIFFALDPNLIIDSLYNIVFTEWYEL